MASTTMRAVGAFNPTAQPIGFLQPLFASQAYSDNQTYIQRLEGWARIEGFESVAWPERDTITFAEQFTAEVGGESVWAFQIPGAPPLVLGWEAFRAALAALIDDAPFANRPLLLFDIVQTLGLELRKPEIFTRAFEAYLRAGRQVAERWRDREILEPLLLQAVTGSKSATQRRPSEAIPLAKVFRARIERNVAKIEIDGGGSPGSTIEFKNALRDIVGRFPEIFPEGLSIEVNEFQNLASRVPSPPKASAVTIVLMGKLRDRQRRLPDLDPLLAEIINLEDLPAHLERRSHSELYLLVATQSEWRRQIDEARRFSELPLIVVSLSINSMPAERDLAFQDALLCPSVTIFTPTANRDRSDATKVVWPLIEILHEDKRPPYPALDYGALPGKHSLLLTADARTTRDPIELSCRLGARALRSGVSPGANVQVFMERSMATAVDEDFAVLFEPLFTPHRTTPVTRLRGPAIGGLKTRNLILLAECNQGDPYDRPSEITEGVKRLLEMRGWQVQHEGRHFSLSEPNRRFSATVVFDKGDIPSEPEKLERPAFGGSPLLVIHVNPRREALLIGNRGQFSHIGIGDIGQMIPGDQWLWRVLRNQLMVPSARQSLAALRLASSLAAEAIRLGRVEFESKGWPMDRIGAALAAKDCERFLEVVPDAVSRRQFVMYMRLQMNDEPPSDRLAPILRLVIDSNGPVLMIG